MGFCVFSLNLRTRVCWALGMELSIESAAGPRVSRAAGSHGSIHDLFLNFVITRKETCLFKVRDGSDYLENMSRIRKRAFAY